MKTPPFIQNAVWAHCSVQCKIQYFLCSISSRVQFGRVTLATPSTKGKKSQHAAHGRKVNHHHPDREPKERLDGGEALDSADDGIESESSQHSTEYLLRGCMIMQGRG